MQISHGGDVTGLVKITRRYMHTPLETVSLGDLEDAAKLIVAALGRISSKDELIPKKTVFLYSLIDHHPLIPPIQEPPLRILL